MSSTNQPSSILKPPSMAQKKATQTVQTNSQHLTPYVTGTTQGRQVNSHGTRPAVGITQLSIRSPLKLKLPSPSVVQFENRTSGGGFRLESESDSQMSVERQLMYKYAIAWNECAIAFKDLQLWSQAAEAFSNSMQLYNKLQHKV